MSYILWTGVWSETELEFLAFVVPYRRYQIILSQMLNVRRTTASADRKQLRTSPNSRRLLLTIVQTSKLRLFQYFFLSSSFLSLFLLFNHVCLVLSFVGATIIIKSAVTVRAAIRCNKHQLSCSCRLLERWGNLRLPVSCHAVALALVSVITVAREYTAAAGSW